MSKTATVTQADMRRAIKAATESGLTVRECEITPRKVRLIFASPEVVDGPPKDPDTPRPKDWPR